MQAGRARKRSASARADDDRGPAGHFGPRAALAGFRPDLLPSPGSQLSLVLAHDPSDLKVAGYGHYQGENDSGCRCIAQLPEGEYPVVDKLFSRVCAEPGALFKLPVLRHLT